MATWWNPFDWSAKATPRPEDPPAADAPPPRQPGMVGMLAAEMREPWPGPEAATLDLKLELIAPDGGGMPGSPGRELAFEQVNSGPAGVVFPAFLPYAFDETGETQSARLAYRKMFGQSPDVKSALLSKILPVCALELRVLPSDDGSALAREQADFCQWSLTRRLRRGFPGLVWDVSIGLLIDGFSVCWKGFNTQDRGKYRGKWPLVSLKPKQVGDDVVPLTDQYRNVIGYRGLRFNSGQEWPPERFLYATHLPLYGSPVGTSDLRAVYGSYWMLDTARKLRAVFMEKRAIPSLIGKYKTGSQKPSLDNALAAFKSQNYISVPDDVMVDVINAAGAADSVFQSFEEDRIAEIYRGINGASLQALEGKTPSGRGSSKVHQGTAEIREWHLSSVIEALLNDHDAGLIRDLVDLNYTMPDDLEYPVAVLGSVDATNLGDDLGIYDGVKNKLGVSLSEADIRKKFNVPAPDKSKPGDEVKAQPPGGAAPGGPPGGPGSLAGLMGGGGPPGGDQGGTGDPDADGGDAAGDDPFNLRGGGGGA